MKLKKAFKIALTCSDATQSDFAQDVGKSKQFISRITTGKEKNAPKMTRHIHDFTVRKLTALRDELNKGIFIEL